MEISQKSTTTMSEVQTIDVLDLGINNISSVAAGLKAASPFVDVNVVSNLADVSSRPRLTVLPGNGSFGAGMSSLGESGLATHLRELAISGGQIFGICLGMQLLFDSSEEDPGVKGLGLFSGKVERLPKNNRTGIQTNIGWAPVSQPISQALHSGLDQVERDVYFVHSYFVRPEFSADIFLESSYDDFVFPAAVRRDNILGVQFHPEKSSNSGIEILKFVLDGAFDKS